MIQILYSKTLLVECTDTSIEEEDLKDTECQRWLPVGGGTSVVLIFTVGPFAVPKFSAVNMH